MKASTQRSLTRWLHIIVGSTIATYIYSPWGEVLVFQLLTKVVLIPLTAITGLWLWKGHLVRRGFTKSDKIVTPVMLLLLLSTPTLSAQQRDYANVDSRAVPTSLCWGAEFSPIGAGVFRLAQGKITYALNPTKQFQTELGLGYLIQPASQAKMSEAFNKDGLYSAYMASIAVRQYFWRGLHFEEVINFGKGSISNSKVDGKNYHAFVVFTQTFLGYKFNLFRREKFSFFIIGQCGFGYVPLNTNQWPRTNSTQIYGLGDLKIGVNF
ncbi:hypothetical protein [Thermoflexibacter ruber]|uniref:Outer membrane protein beta-barrel domain-containing protein n=1 Tax=Thermoflexibacter ruber TaxID=1003 RepID=A0A1I2EI98_9BACT|nr:hypothetical protein [Thermoflexibacter ruber]SFE92814.1 hypothetical protein SAMN04488541_101046 [Thermoflexibacter ruber]